MANAFFNIPLHPDSQYWFACTFKMNSWTWSHVLQGFSESPAIFSTALHKNLEGSETPHGSTLVQYVDNLLLCSDSEQDCKTDTVALLLYWAAQGWVNQEVIFLGHWIYLKGKKLSDDRIQTFLKISKPITKKQMMAFWGITGYCRQWILDYAQVSRGLVGYQKRKLFVPHKFSIHYLEQNTSHLTPARMMHYHNALYSLPIVTITQCNVLNPATLLQKPIVRHMTVWWPFQRSVHYAQFSLQIYC